MPPDILKDNSEHLIIIHIPSTDEFNLLLRPLFQRLKIVERYRISFQTRVFQDFKFHFSIVDDKLLCNSSLTPPMMVS